MSVNRPTFRITLNFEEVPVSVTFLGIIALFGVIGFFSEGFTKGIAFIPAYTLIMDVKLWNIFTGSFFNNSPIGLILSLITLACIMPPIELGWTKYPFLFYWIGMSAGISAVNFFICVIFYGLTEKMPFLTTPIITMYGIIEALLMGLAELFPTAYIASIKQLKFRYLPLYFHLFSYIIPLLYSQSWIYPIMTGYTFFISWIILRYYIILKDGSQGDHSEAFAFIQLSPELLKPLFVLMSNGASFVFRPFIERQKPQQKQRMINSEYNDDPITTRRRERALKALDEKLKQLENGPPPS